MPISPEERRIAVQVRVGRDGRASGATATTRIERPIADVWSAVTDVEGFARHVRMIHSARRRGDEVTLDMKYKIGIFFNVGFAFTARAVETDGTSAPEGSAAWSKPGTRILELRWISGEPRDIRLRFELTSEDDGRATKVDVDAEFDPMSLGWLAKYFLQSHPEIQFGIFPGVALVLTNALEQSIKQRR